MRAFCKLFRHLDVQLSSLVGGVVILWFLSFLFSANILNGERVEKNTFLEKERIRMKVESELTGILNDILLRHSKSLELTIEDIYQKLGLTSIELQVRGGRTIRYGNPKTDGTHFLLAQRFPIRMEGKELGVLSVGKELWGVKGSEAVSKSWIVGIAAIMILIFYLIRQFIRKQIVDPLKSILQSFSVSETGGTSIQSHSFEMDEVLQSFHKMRAKLHDYQEKSIEHERHVALGELAAQVAHDIRSPLTALSVVNEDLSELPEIKRKMVANAVVRIREIANNLLEKKSESPDEMSASLVPPKTQEVRGLIEEIISEKRIQFKDRPGVKIFSEYNQRVPALYVNVDASEFKRILSNIIDNAVEAISEWGEVRVWGSASDGRVHLRIVDNGVGISSDIQKRLFQKGSTFGKKNGSGLGLFQAKEVLNRWGGTISLESKVGLGTVVTICLPQLIKSAGLPECLQVPKEGTIAILDDEETMYLFWKKRFQESFGSSENLVYFSAPEALAEWSRTPGNSAGLYLVDFEMRSHILNGLDVIESLAIERKSVLVTGYYADRSITERCQKMGIPLLSKSLAESIPLQAN